MKKKLVSIFLAAAMVVAVAAGCGNGNTGNSESKDVEGSSGEEAGDPEEAGGPEEAGDSETKTEGSKHIYVLTAPEDHGWTGSVAKFAKEKIGEVNEDGAYEAELITSASAAEQITNIEDIISKGESDIAVVIQPIDDTVQSAVQGLVDAGIPYVAFDRIIDGVASSAVANVKGDNEGIGVAAAAYYVSLGMKPGDKVYVYQGDTSSVTTLRDQIGRAHV